MHGNNAWLIHAHTYVLYESLAMERQQEVNTVICMLGAQRPEGLALPWIYYVYLLLTYHMYIAGATCHSDIDDMR